MSTLQITSLECIKKQDSVSKDEIYLKLNGYQVECGTGYEKNSGPRSLTQLIDPQRFTGKMTVELFERDRGSKDDTLGIIHISDSVTKGEVKKSFNDRAGAEYELSYKVRL